ncbi:GntR family transcriptional regulator [Ancylobacter sp. G4_0304]|uniref:GntR family transcriptional regulator n=1 Tax=Ancylobacter sp. G4_0304 TaxID=3114289 RepID=UPI0039C5C26E
MIDADPLDRFPSPEEAEAAGGEATLHGNLVAQLRAILMEGELPAGSRIPEAELCRRFRVSRTPLREALKVMAAEGFVILRPNRGAIVAPVDPDEIAPLFEFKGALERLIGLTAAERASAEEIAALDAIHVELKAALAQGEHDDYTRLNYAFHRGLAQATRNPVLIQSYEALQQKIWRYRFIVNEHEQRLQESFAEHERVIVALRARTPLDLAERLETHNRLTGLAMVELMRRAADAETSKTRGKSRATTRSATTS